MINWAWGHESLEKTECFALVFQLDARHILTSPWFDQRLGSPAGAAGTADSLGIGAGPSRFEDSTYFHRRVTHLTALRVLRLGAGSAVMGAHHKGRATRAQGSARPPEGSLFAATGGRRRRLTMSRHRRRAASYPEAAKSDHMCHPSMKVSTRPARHDPNSGSVRSREPKA